MDKGTMDAFRESLDQVWRDKKGYRGFQTLVHAKTAMEDTLTPPVQLYLGKTGFHQPIETSHRWIPWTG